MVFDFEYNEYSIQSVLNASEQLTGKQSRLISRLIDDIERINNVVFNSMQIENDKYNDYKETLIIKFVDGWAVYIEINEDDYKQIEQDYNAFLTYALETTTQ